MRTFLIIICTVVLLFSVFQIAQYLLDAKHTEDLYADIAETYHKEGEDRRAANPDGEDPSDGNRLEDIRKINPDVVGWISIPGTGIDYPVVQGEDNDYYLHHDIRGQKNKHGAIFMDHSNHPGEDRSLVIYGHHMKDGTMFYDLKKFKKKDFYDKNKSILLNIQGKTVEYEIFSAYIGNASSLHLKISFPDASAYRDYFTEIKAKSMYPSDMDFSEDQTMLTLSTCTYEEKDARLILHAFPKEKQVLQEAKKENPVNRFFIACKT